jgi:hypothetical protein
LDVETSASLKGEQERVEPLQKELVGRKRKAAETEDMLQNPEVRAALQIKRVRMDDPCRSGCQREYWELGTKLLADRLQAMNKGDVRDWTKLDFLRALHPILLMTMAGAGSLPSWSAGG